MQKSDPWDLFRRYWQHTGGRMAADSAALIFGERLDSPYIRTAEEVPQVRALLAFLTRIAGRASSTVRDCELFIHQ